MHFLQIIIEQQRFLYPENDIVSSHTSLWHIPLTYVTNNDPTAPSTQLMTSQNFALAFDQEFKWIKFNHNFTGYYRVISLVVFKF